jgi:hypothetical protein
VLDVVDGLLEKDADVRVVQGVNHAPALALTDNESEVSQQSQLV